jgi:hypothetical protein
MKLKVISILILRTSSIPIVFLLNPGVTARQILEQLRVEDDYVLYPAEDPARLFDHKDELYDQVKDGDRLNATVLAEATRAYQRSQLYRQPQQYPIGDPQ